MDSSHRRQRATTSLSICRRLQTPFFWPRALGSVDCDRVTCRILINVCGAVTDPLSPSVHGHADVKPDLAHFEWSSVQVQLPTFPSVPEYCRATPTDSFAWENRCHRQSIPPSAATLPPGAAPANGAPAPTPKGFAPRIAAGLGRCLRAPARPEVRSTCTLRPAASLAHRASRDGSAPSAPRWPASLARTLPADLRKFAVLGYSCPQSVRRPAWRVNTYLT